MEENTFVNLIIFIIIFALIEQIPVFFSLKLQQKYDIINSMGFSIEKKTFNGNKINFYLKMLNIFKTIKCILENRD